MRMKISFVHFMAMSFLCGFAVKADDLETILGSPTSEWRVARIQGATDDHALVDVDGRPTLIAGPNAVSLTSLNNGDRIQHDPLIKIPGGGIAEPAAASARPPTESKSTTIQGVPFAWPRVDDRGNDHIDVGRSWMRFGVLEGGFDGWSGDPARWRGALSGEPGRIQFRVRNARYSKLHLRSR